MEALFRPKVVHVSQYLRWRLGKWETVVSHYRSLPRW